MTIDRIDLIDQLEELFQSCFNKEKSSIEDDRINQNDVRVTFYKHLNNTIDSSIHLLIVTHKYLPDEHWWEDIQAEYKILPRSFSDDQIQNYVFEFSYIEQHLAFSYFLHIYHTFESCVRIIFKDCYPDEYFHITNRGKKKHRDFSSIITNMMSKSRINKEKDRNQFFEIILKYRNSIHTNGVYISPSSCSKEIEWNNNIYDFKHGYSIWKEDLWIHYILFTYEFIKIFEEISNSIMDKSHPIIDISEVMINQDKSI